MLSSGRKDSKTANRGPVVSIDNDVDDGDTRVTTFKLVPERPKTPERKPGFVSTTRELSSLRISPHF